MWGGVRCGGEDGNGCVPMMICLGRYEVCLIVGFGCAVLSESDEFGWSSWYVSR